MAGALWLVGDLLADRKGQNREGSDLANSRAGELEVHAI
jgi:hypothetical protein